MYAGLCIKLYKTLTLCTLFHVKLALKFHQMYAKILKDYMEKGKDLYLRSLV